MSSQTFLPFEHAFLREMKKQGLEAHHLFLAVSGGLDSMVLLELMIRVSSALKINFSIAHIHHGGVSEYRSRAWKLVKEQALKNDLAFHSNLQNLDNVNSTELKNESELRDYRYSELFKILNKQEGPGSLVLAHHRSDLLETRMMRLIRGVGADSLESMSAFQDNKLRPLLGFSRSELEDYAKERDISYIDDPSNEINDAFRNWIRNDWLPQLEARSKGSLKSLANSLELMSQKFKSAGEPVEFNCIEGRKINLQQFIGLGSEQKKSALIAYFKSLNLKNYTANHAIEILRQLDNPSRVHSFTMLKMSWNKDGQYLTAKPMVSGK